MNRLGARIAATVIGLVLFCGPVGWVIYHTPMMSFDRTEIVTGWGSLWRVGMIGLGTISLAVGGLLAVLAWQRDDGDER